VLQWPGSPVSGQCFRAHQLDGGTWETCDGWGRGCRAFLLIRRLLDTSIGSQPLILWALCRAGFFLCDARDASWMVWLWWVVTFGEGSRSTVEGICRGAPDVSLHDSWMVDQWMDGAALDRRMAVDLSEWPRTRSVVAPRDTSIDHSGGMLWPASQMVEARFAYRSVYGMDVRYEVMQVRLMTTRA
jgi:hypothetical protein